MGFYLGQKFLFHLGQTFDCLYFQNHAKLLYSTCNLILIFHLLLLSMLFHFVLIIIFHLLLLSMLFHFVLILFLSMLIFKIG